ncbi:MAG: hypothetical protein ACYDHX_01345 [Methanothrix sp.]
MFGYNIQLIVIAKCCSFQNPAPGKLPSKARRRLPTRAQVPPPERTHAGRSLLQNVSPSKDV